jgi:hypothetical protein
MGGQARKKRRDGLYIEGDYLDDRRRASGGLLTDLLALFHPLILRPGFPWLNSAWPSLSLSYYLWGPTKNTGGTTAEEPNLADKITRSTGNPPAGAARTHKRKIAHGKNISKTWKWNLLKNGPQHLVTISKNATNARYSILGIDWTGFFQTHLIYLPEKMPGRQQ